MIVSARIAGGGPVTWAISVAVSPSPHVMTHKTVQILGTPRTVERSPIRGDRGDERKVYTCDRSYRLTGLDTAFHVKHVKLKREQESALKIATAPFWSA